MAKQRRHYWVITFQRFREEKDGSRTAMTPADSLEVPDKTLYEVATRKGQLNIIRPGRDGIVDALITRMTALSKDSNPWNLIEVIDRGPNSEHDAVVARAARARRGA